MDTDTLANTSAHSLDNVLELALHNLISQRCKSSYAHDLRNGLQGIQGSFDVFKRLLTNLPSAAPLPVEKSSDMARRALANHESALERILNHLVPEEAGSVSIRVDESLRAVAGFLNSDAAAHNVSLHVAADSAVSAIVRAHALRLTLLSLLIDAIDVMPTGGQVQMEVRTDDRAAVVEIIATPKEGTLQRDYTTAWQLNLATTPQRTGLIFYVVQRLVEADAGVIELAPHGAGSKVSIKYPVAA